MWLKRRQRGNRRLRRQNVLDVRLRTREVRASRLRLLGAVVAVTVGTTVALWVLWRGGEWGLRRLVFENPSFRVRRLQIDTGGLLPAELVRQWAGVRSGDNLLALDLERIRRDLLLVPVVASASLQRVPPDTLRVRVAGRLPMAEIVLGRPRGEDEVDLVSYYLDVEGHVIRFAGLEHAELVRRLVRTPLPRMTGLDRGLLPAGRRVEQASVLAALQLLKAFESSPMFGLAAILSVDVSRPDAVEVLTEQGSRITFGRGEPARQLAHWRAVHDYAAVRGKVIVSLDLSVSRNVPAVFADAEPPVDRVVRPVRPPAHPSTS